MLSHETAWLTRPVPLTGKATVSGPASRRPKKLGVLNCGPDALVSSHLLRRPTTLAFRGGVSGNSWARTACAWGVLHYSLWKPRQRWRHLLNLNVLKGFVARREGERRGFERDSPGAAALLRQSQPTECPSEAV